MSFKKMIFVLTISISSVFLLMFGTSYAYYVSDADVNLNVTTGDFDNAVSVVFRQSEYINLKTGVPITENEITEKASKSIFTLVPNSTILDGYDASISISLTDISIDDELRVSDLKYNLSCDLEDDDNFIYIEVLDEDGTGEDFTDEVIESGNLVIGTLSNFNVNFPYSCVFSVYLLETGENQNELMNKNFSARIKVNSAFRK